MAVSSKDRISTGKKHVGRRPTHTAREGQCGNFLTQRFDCIHAYDIETVTRRCGEIDLPALTEQVRSLFSVYDKKLNFESTGNKFHDAAMLSEAIKENVKEMDVELVEIDNGDTSSVEFVAYKLNDGLDTSNLYFLPIRILECVDDKLKEILLDFFAFLSQFSLFRLPYDSYEMCQALGIEYDADEIKYDPEVELSPEYKKLTDRYVQGDVRAYFDTITAKREAKKGCFHELVFEVREGMTNYDGGAYYQLPNGENRHVSELFEVLEEGIDLNTEDSLGNYDIAPIRYDLGDETFLEEEGCSDEMLCLDSLFTFSYGFSEDDDKSVGEVIDIFNRDNCNMGMPVLVEVEKISKCRYKLEPSDYPKRWSDWYKKLITFIYE